MRVLLVALPEDERVVQHAQLLRSAGWSVELASPRPLTVTATRFHACRLHHPPRPTYNASSAPKGAVIRNAKVHAARRVHLAAARVSYRVAAGLRAVSGVEIETGPLALRPVDESG